jgi:MinD-like ATPase involved in chromosome partitioning or flagellar assembly
LYVITFYSFKGGVGRTMALVNVAAELARRGRKVLVVDFDLEAPGLETYQRLQPPKPHRGIVEYVTEYRRTNSVPNLLDYIYETKPIGKKGGKLWVMPAGRRDAAYRSALARLDWQKLYRDEQGFMLLEDTKLGWEQELKPDYVLIDSRTGDTDVLGICTRQLPDSVVLMFTPNEQNLSGLESVWHDIVYEETHGLKKFIQPHFVAANVPNLDDERGILRRRLRAFLGRLRIRWLSGIIRRYENLELLDQSIFTLDRPRTRLARSYRQLARTLRIGNLSDRDGVLQFLGRPTRGLALNMEDSVTLQDAEIKRLYRIARHFKEDIEVLNRVALSLRRHSQYKSAMLVFDRVLELDPANTYAQFHIAFGSRRYVKADASAGEWPEGE